MPERAAPEECAICGAAIPRGAKACPECGADERNGWREQSVYDGIDLPDEAYDDDVQRPPVHRVNQIAWYWWCLGVLVAVMFALWALRLW